MTPATNYLAGYPPALQSQVQALLADNRLGALLQRKHPGPPHGVRTDTALYAYVMELKNTYLRSSEPLSKVVYDSKLHVIQHALGTHTTISRVQGARLKSKREIRVAALFRDLPLPLLRMIVVHELAHLKEKAHDKAFYQLCQRMEPDYHQLELDLRMALLHMQAHGPIAWGAVPPA